MYIECKAGNLPGPARIGRVTIPRLERRSTTAGKNRSLKGSGFKANSYDVETGEEYWISGPEDGRDALYATNIVPEINEDIREEY